MENGTAQNKEIRLATAGQIKDICAVAVQGVPAKMSFGEAANILRRKERFVKHIESFFKNGVFADWRNFYRTNFDIKLGDLELPAESAEFVRPIIVAKDLTPNRVFDVCVKNFPSWRYVDDLDKSFVNNDRYPENSYAVLVRDTIETEGIHAGKTAEELAEAGIKGITLLERMIFELKYFTETRGHLDTYNQTLCSGSRNIHDLVSTAYSNGEMFRIYNIDQFSAGYLRLRCREVAA